MMAMHTRTDIIHDQKDEVSPTLADIIFTVTTGYVPPRHSVYRHLMIISSWVFLKLNLLLLLILFDDLCCKFTLIVI